MTEEDRNPENENTQGSEGVLVSAARTLGHAAGATAKALGLEHAGESEESGDEGHAQRKKLSGRARRIADATAAKESAAALGKDALASDARYRRIAGKKPEIWSQEDIDYVTGLVSNKQA